MPAGLTAAEILRIAEQLERDAAEYYRRMADSMGDTPEAEPFLELARWEAEHARRLAAIQPGARSRRDVSPDCRALAALNLFAAELKRAPTPRHKTDPRRLIRLAVQNEYNAIRYIQGLRNFIADPAALETIREMIEDERRHIEILQQMQCRIDPTAPSWTHSSEDR